jgi:hypothetical protein
MRRNAFMKATKIKMKPGCGQSNNTVEIDEIFIEGFKAGSKDGFYKKGVVHDHLKANPGSIQVNIYPYPDCIPAISGNGEKYVRSMPNDSVDDNLLKLPRV